MLLLSATSITPNGFVISQIAIIEPNMPLHAWRASSCFVCGQLCSLWPHPSQTSEEKCHFFKTVSFYVLSVDSGKEQCCSYKLTMQSVKYGQFLQNAEAFITWTHFCRTGSAGWRLAGGSAMHESLTHHPHPHIIPSFSLSFWWQSFLKPLHIIG